MCSCLFHTISRERAVLVFYLLSWKPGSLTRSLTRLFHRFFPLSFPAPLCWERAGEAREGKKRKRRKCETRGEKSVRQWAALTKGYDSESFLAFLLLFSFSFVFSFIFIFVFVRIFVCYTLLSRPSFLTTCSLSLSLSLLGVDKLINRYLRAEPTEADKDIVPWWTR